MIQLHNFRMLGCSDHSPNTLYVKGDRYASAPQLYAKHVVRIDCENHFLVPGLVDIQLYGAGGIVFSNELSVESLEKIHLHHLRHGTTNFLITVPTLPMPAIKKAILAVKTCMANNNTGLLGLHLEGPFINPLRKGAHNEQGIISPNLQDIEEIITQGKGIIKMITLAPEMFQPALLQKFIDCGITVSAGHSNANFAQAKAAFEQGVSCCTHLYNAMSQLESRAAGLVGACLTHENIWATVVADGCHVCYETLRLTFKLKSEKLILISDATFLEAENGPYTIEGTIVTKQNNAYYTKENKLAGSAISLLHALQNVVKYVGVLPAPAVHMATQRPAALLAITDIGNLEIGSYANFLLLDDNLALKKVFFQGEAKPLQDAH